MEVCVPSLPPEEGLTPLEWYFILTYCAAAVLVLLIVVVLLYVFYSLRGFCFTRVAETRRVRTRVRREKPQKILLGRWCVCAHWGYAPDVW